MPQLGRLHQSDVRNWPASLLVSPDTVIKTKMHSMFYKELDQSATSTCVGHAGKHFMLLAPIIQTKPNWNPTAIDLYLAAAKIDEWSQNDNGDLQFGTSILALMKAMQDMGLVTNYLWANGVTQLARWISEYGPAVIGVNWYTSMFTPTTQGILEITPNSNVVGGHALAVRGWNVKTGMFRVVNSWGPMWGDGGQCWIPGELMERLIREDGEIALPTEIRVPRPA